jgi:uncharacterized protein HemX
MSAVVAALVTSAVAAVAGVGYSLYAGEQGRKAQKEAANRQEAAQREAATQARSQQRRSQQAMAMANRREPNVASILQSTMDAGGPTSTMLTGPMGVNPADLNLGRQSLLGG